MALGALGTGTSALKISGHTENGESVIAVIVTER